MVNEDCANNSRTKHKMKRAGTHYNIAELGTYGSFCGQKPIFLRASETPELLPPVASCPAM